MFNIGDRVVCLRDFEDAPITGREATVVLLYSKLVGLCFDSIIDPNNRQRGHNHSMDSVPAHCGWNVPKTFVEKIGTAFTKEQRVINKIVSLRTQWEKKQLLKKENK